MSTMNRAKMNWPIYSIAVAALACCLPRADAIDKTDIDVCVEQVKRGEGGEKLRWMQVAIESSARGASDDAKEQCINSLLRLSIAVLGTRDRSVDLSSRLGIWPDFDARAYGSKLPVFAGVDPAGISDPRVREAYRLALQSHREKLTKVVMEKQKIETAEALLRAAKRIMDGFNSKSAIEHARETVGKLASPDIAAEIAAIMFPSATSSADAKAPSVVPRHSKSASEDTSAPAPSTTNAPPPSVPRELSPSK